jgi:hypothetical protein
MARRKSSRRDPAPAEILHLCAQIRRGWSEMTHRVRAGFGENYEAVTKREAWSPPVVPASELELPRELLPS